MTTLVFILVLLSFPPYEISALTPFVFYPLALLSLGRIPPGPIAGRMILAAPFALLLLAFNPLFDREQVMLAGAYPLAAGWLSLASGMLRFFLCAGAALILLASAGITGLCSGLSGLGLPRAFVVQVFLLYRYLFVISAQALSVMRAASLRGAREKRIGVREYAAILGSLLLRSLDRASRAYQAMLARGFKGEIHLAGAGGLKAADFVFTGAWILFFMFARKWNLAEELGNAISGGRWRLGI